MAPRGKLRLSKASTSSGLVDGAVDQASTKSAYKNISQFKNSKKWGAWLSHGGKRFYMGSWVDEELAVRAQDRATLKLKGPEAKTIFNPSDYEDDKKLWPTMGDTAFVDMLKGESRNCYKPTPKSKCMIRILERRSDMEDAPMAPNDQLVETEPQDLERSLQGSERVRLDQDEDSESSLECDYLREFRESEGENEDSESSLETVYLREWARLGENSGRVRERISPY